MKRIYPAGNICRHFSTNIDPEIFWNQKINFVAMNCQTIDNNYIKNYSFIHFSEY